jgi:SSS family solute:Na+ symporter
MMMIPVGLFISLTGFVVYRFRRTRALTLAQFFEQRYSRRFRLFAGCLCWLSGIFNYGIFPAVTARFIIFFFGLPEHFSILGLTVSMFPLVMLAYLSVALFSACAGGQISIMITDFFQGIMMMMIFLILMFYLLHLYRWDELMAGLSLSPDGKSMLNPFKTAEVEDFNVWYFLIGVLGAVLNTRAWQGNSGYNASAKTPHEAVMAGIISGWREIAQGLCMLLIPLAAYTILHLPEHSAAAAAINGKIAGISDPVIRGQMTVPLFLAHTLPVGLTGLFAAVIVACAISCDNSYLHAWGTIFIQDVYIPLRGKPVEPRKHMLLLRLSICGVAAFGFLFSLLFPLKDFIAMYFALTGAIYLGGAGAVIIGGLYWKWGSTEAAWTSLIVGTILAFGGMLLQQIWSPLLAPFLLSVWPDLAWVAGHKDKFPVNGQIVFFVAMVSSLTSYILVSLLWRRRVHDMDRLLRRGAHTVRDDASPVSHAVAAPSGFSLGRLIGITPDFTRFDRVVAWATFLKSMAFWTVFIIGTIICLTTGLITDEIWKKYWWWQLVALPLSLGVICTVWISLGGIRDAVRLFKDLAGERIDEADDGFVKKASSPDDTVSISEDSGRMRSGEK